MANRYIPPMSDSTIRSLRHQTVDGVDKYKEHFVGLVDGLSLKCNPPKKDKDGKLKTKVGSRSWILHYSFAGEPDTKGMGGYPSTSTAEAVRKAQEWRSLLAQGIDPREEERNKVKRLERNQKLSIPFSVAAENWCDFQISRPNRSSQDYQKKFNAVKRHIFPLLGKRPIGSINFEEVLTALRTIWEVMPPTAWKIQGAMRQIFDHAGLKGDLNVARWTDNLDQQLPHPDEFHEAKRQPSLDWRLVPEFVEKLQDHEIIGAKALMLHILTVGRSETICLAEREQFDFEKKVWHRPKEIMKAVQFKGKSVKYPHDQPLSDSTIEFLLSIKGQKFAGGFVSEEGLIFRGEKKGERIYDRHLSECIPQLGYKREDVVPHGFRGSFKNWNLDKSHYGELIGEKCMAHKIGDEVRNRYVTTEFVEKRRPCVEDWCKWCFEGSHAPKGNVSDISEARA